MGRPAVSPPTPPSPRIPIACPTVMHILVGLGGRTYCGRVVSSGASADSARTCPQCVQLQEQETIRFHRYRARPHQIQRPRCSTARAAGLMEEIEQRRVREPRGVDRRPPGTVTSRETWEKLGLGLSYFDGRCEVQMAETMEARQVRCACEASRELNGFAVCASHARSIRFRTGEASGRSRTTASGFWPPAGVFRFGHLASSDVAPGPRPRPSDQWDW
jgi:hypothetical protein